MWSLGFPHLSGAGGAILTVASDGPTRVTSQIDVVAIDDEVCIAIECKSRQTLGRRDGLQEEMAKHALIREKLANAVSGRGKLKRSVALGFWTSNAVISANDRERAKAQNMALLTDADLTYYEELAKQIGPAARYQILADFLPGRPVPGLAIRVPALSAKMGGFRAFTFTVTPDWLLKVAYISHRARGKSSDVRTYQRMIKKRRLAEIRAFLSEPSAIFPTNLVISLEAGKHGSGASFEEAKQDPDAEGSALGWLTVKPTYKSAWVIDGQHRLYAYSGHPRAIRDQLTVVAFEGLPGSVQQQLFIDINSKQKSVKPSLLQELYADINRDSDDPRKVTQALISESVQMMDADPQSPLYGRVLLSDESRTPLRCISLTALFSALEKPGLYYRSVQNKAVVNPGPFWSSDDSESIDRTTLIVSSWLREVRDRTSQWWDAGSGPGGGLAMNDGVTVSVNVLRSVVEHLDAARATVERRSAE
jgi:DNA sulfur modification protein DndB